MSKILTTTMSALPGEILCEIFSYTNVGTVIRGRSCSHDMNSLLEKLCENMMRPKNFRMRLFEEYVDEQYPTLKLIDSKGQKYILGAIDPKYPRGTAPDEGFRGFTHLFKVKLHELYFIFGYSEYRYVVYTFTRKGQQSGTYKYLDRRAVKDIGQLSTVLNTEYDTRLIVAYVQHLIRNMPCSEHDVQICEILKGSPLYPIRRRDADKEIYLDSTMGMGVNLLLGYTTVYVNPEKFEKYRWFLDLHAKVCNYTIMWEKKEDCRIIVSGGKREGYYFPASSQGCTQERLDEYVDTKILIQQFSKITCLTLKMIQNMVVYASGCGNPRVGLEVAKYVESKQIDDELTVCCCYVILYYGVSPDAANSYVLNWLRTRKSSGLKKDLWLVNWKYYSVDVQIGLFMSE